jgi:hypothetical protein
VSHDLVVTPRDRVGEPRRHHLEAPTVAGGSRGDGLFVPGVAPGALRLFPVASGVVLEALASGVRAAGHPLRPGARRLLRAGERAELPGAAIRVAAPPSPGPQAAGTRVAAASLLRDAAAGDGRAPGLHLLVLTGPAAGERHALAGARTIGRGRGADVRIPDPHASRVHARLVATAEGITVEDLGSKNGVRVNGVVVEPGARAVAPGDELGVGETLLALEEADAAPPREAARPVAGRLRSAPRRLAAAALLLLSAAALALAGS